MTEGQLGILRLKIDQLITLDSVFFTRGRGHRYQEVAPTFAPADLCLRFGQGLGVVWPAIAPARIPATHSRIFVSHKSLPHLNLDNFPRCGGNGIPCF